MSIIRVAAIQAAPVYFDLEASLEKAISLIEDAASQGAEFIVFPETWLPGYPAWLDCCRDVALWDHPPVKRVFADLMKNAVAIPSPTTERLGKAAKKHNIVLNISAHERVVEGPGHGTLYNTMLMFDTDGSLIHKHRKIMPTYSERLIWGQGDGTDLNAINTALGRFGGLICWEHWMPLARQALHDSQESIHVAAWPQVKEMNLVASRHYAFEGRCYVIATGAIMQASMLPPEFEAIEPFASNSDAFVLNGGSCIIGPDGSILQGPIFDVETILIEDLDLSVISEENLTLDVTGHYSRPDIFQSR
jgi:predicted amidohydrolase